MLFFADTNQVSDRVCDVVRAQTVVVLALLVVFQLYYSHFKSIMNINILYSSSGGSSNRKTSSFSGESLAESHDYLLEAGAGLSVRTYVYCNNILFCVN